VLSGLWIRVCAWFVPAGMRARWREEWLAEIGAGSKPVFDWRTRGALWDAIDCGRRRQPRTMHASMIWYDVKSGLRQLQRHRAFTTLAVIVLALGIGINSAIVSVVYTVFFKPWPIEKPEEVAFVYQNQRYGRTFPAMFPGRNQRQEVLDSNPGIAGFASSWGIYRTLQIDGLSERTWGELVSTNYFDVLGVRPIAGRTFTTDDNETNPDLGIVISYELWKERFGGASDVVGRPMRVHSRDVRVIGVMGPAFRGLTGMWTPSRWWAVGDQFMPRGGRAAIFRLKPGVTIEQLQLSMNVLGARENEEQRKRDAQYGREYALPPGMPKYVVRSANDVRMPHEFGSAVIPERVASALAIVVVMVLVIAAINITGLLLARGMTRTNELATRRALGVTPVRLARQLLAETIVLALSGGLLGLLLAWNLTNLFTKFTPDNFSFDAGLDGRVLMFTVLVCVGTGIVIGLAPVRQALKVDVLAALAGGYRDSGRTRRKLRHWVVVPQVALSLLVLIVTAVHVRSLRQLEDATLGYEPNQATVLSLSRDTPEDIAMRQSRPDAEVAREYQQLYRTLHNMLSAVPGLHAGLVANLPLSSTTAPDLATTEAAEAVGKSDALPVQPTLVSPGAFEALGMRLLDGRDFDDRDTRQVRAVAIVSQSVARRLWPGQRAVGQRIGSFSPQQSGAKTEWFEVIGVVNDTQAVLAKPNDPARIYRALGQAWRPWAWSLVVRGAGPDAISELRSKIGGIDPFLSANQVRPLKAYVDELLYPRRLATAILGVSGFVGFGLACVGLYGVVSFSVARRLRELGIRATLGARPGDLVRLILEEGGRMAAIGTVIGLTGGIAALRYTAHMAEGIPTTDWFVFLLVPTALTFVLLVACYFPARRAGLVDPVETLRE
jgi:predicted permease